ncbi:MAG TPA: hypothetical protein PLA97_11215, partial [Rubrivivax sp.]|nr:hypothetical protein [Rubrivivax sp.]
MSAPLSSSTLGAALQRAAQFAGAAPALLGDFGHLSCAELWACVQPVAARLQALAATGREPGSPLQAHAVVLR